MIVDVTEKETPAARAEANPAAGVDKPAAGVEKDKTAAAAVEKDKTAADVPLWPDIDSLQAPGPFQGPRVVKAGRRRRRQQKVVSVKVINVPAEGRTGVRDFKRGPQPDWVSGVWLNKWKHLPNMEVFATFYTGRCMSGSVVYRACVYMAHLAGQKQFHVVHPETVLALISPERSSGLPSVSSLDAYELRASKDFAERYVEGLS